MLENEQLLSFAEAAKTLPPMDGRRVHVSTLWRWARIGVKGQKLDVRRLGGRFVTSVEALERFSKALAEVPLGGIRERAPVHEARTTRSGPTRRERTQKQREKDIARAEEVLRRANI